MEFGACGIQRQTAAAGQRRGSYQKQVASEFLAIRWQRATALGVIASNRRPLENPGRQLKGWWSRGYAVAAEAVGKTIKLETIGSAPSTVRDKQDGLAGKLAGV